MPDLAVSFFVIHDTKPFGLSLSKPFDWLTGKGSKLPIMMGGSLNSLQPVPATVCRTLF